jgi:hypothetical protein
LTWSSGIPWQASKLHAGGVRGLEHAIALGGEQGHGHVVEKILVAARGAHQVAVKVVALDRVRNDAREHAGVDAALLEIVLRAFANGDESLLVVVGAGEHDDGREIRNGAQVRATPAARWRPEAEIQQHEIVFHFLQALGRFARGLHPVTDDFVEPGILEMRSTTRASAGLSSTNNSRMFLSRIRWCSSARF